MTTQLPQKTREIHNHHFDSTVWNDFKFRDDDIVISSYAKSGTTWLQQIIGQLIFDGSEEVNVGEASPWIDLRVPPKEVKMPMVEGQEHRRFVKTHLPVDALVFSEKAKYVYIGRDGRDIVWSLHNHHTNANDSWYGALNGTPGLVGPPIEKPNPDIHEYFLEWLENNGEPFWPYWENVRSWWALRNLPNVHMLHFGALKEDMPGEIQKIAKFLDIEIDPKSWEKILQQCSFQYMKKNAAKSVPLGGIFWEGGAETFIHKGTNGRWRDILSAEENARYEAKAVEELGSECARWLATGK